MIIRYMRFLKNNKIILASGSPRRKEILQNIGLDVIIEPSTFVENLDANKFEDISSFCIATAKGKAEEVLNRLGSEANIIISADTCVSLGGILFGKPKDNIDAIDMLKRLSGVDHDVVTGVSLYVRDMKNLWEKNYFSETTRVTFASLTEEEITAYVDTQEPLDKAGGYGIQGLGGTLITGISGDYYNVMGFPLHKFCCQLSSILERLM